MWSSGQLFGLVGPHQQSIPQLLSLASRVYNEITDFSLESNWGVVTGSAVNYTTVLLQMIITQWQPSPPILSGPTILQSSTHQLNVDKEGVLIDLRSTGYHGTLEKLKIQLTYKITSVLSSFFSTSVWISVRGVCEWGRQERKWISSNPDTNGTEESVHISEVSLLNCM